MCVCSGSSDRVMKGCVSRGVGDGVNGRFGVGDGIKGWFVSVGGVVGFSSVEELNTMGSWVVAKGTCTFYTS